MNFIIPKPADFTVVDILIKLAVMALLAGFVARFGRFRHLLLIEQRGPREKIQFAAFLGLPFMVGVLTRLLASYPTTDLSLEVTVLAGLLGGTIVGLAVALIVSLPILMIALWAAVLSFTPFLVHGLPAWLMPHERPELLALPMATLYAVWAGTARWLCPDKEQIWKFSPFIEQSLYRSIRQKFRHPEIDWQVLFWLSCVVLEISRMMVGHISRGTLFYPSSPHYWTRALIVLGTLIGVGLPVRIWNTTRIEQKLVEQEKALLQARMDALISQINPHFLFNTLNTISSLIRFDPDMARTVLLKLSNILRRRLKAQVHFSPLRQELEFIDDYLDIEVVRFGRDKLQVRKEIDPDTLDMVVPSMLLQPLVENALRHGIAPKIEGGVLTLRAKRGKGRLVVEVIDDGVGMSEQRPPESQGSGIGISNVRERLEVVYGQDFSLKIDSRPGEGTAIRFEIPELATALPAPPAEVASVAS
ncbi:MAG TPA: histidine kinase [Terriglobia bacterium]|nr:histidine kinase [Terriglobia bacterium]